MLIHADIEHKSIGNKTLFTNLRLTVDDHEKVAIIGRNGVGKSTLFRMLSGEDHDYTGSIVASHGVRMAVTQQEHHGLGDQTTEEYILSRLPDYSHLKHIIETFPDHMGDDMRKITVYSNALSRFADHDYYTINDRIRRSLEAYQLSPNVPMASLSGGQKRFVELVCVEHSDATLALIDEPTNHMDYVAKAAFIDWFQAVRHAVVVITHDRDVLTVCDRIIEIKDQTAYNFPGNYNLYLRENATRTTNSLTEYETVQRRIANIKKQVQDARAKKAIWRGTADKKNPFVVIETRLTKELDDLQARERPSFWIDKESIEGIRPKVEASYQKHKAKTIHIRHSSHEERARELVTLDHVQLGYNGPLFAPINLRIATGQRLRIIGRNGAGKTTLVNAVVAAASGKPFQTLLSGSINVDTKIRINTYEQENSDNLLSYSLAKALEWLHAQYGIQLTNEQIMRILADYLFDPYEDRDLLVSQLSGGQKARLQLIKMFANNPNLLILDEPTNHLDLPSIEELESALASYKGTLIYISHDSYLAKHLGGDSLTLTR